MATRMYKALFERGNHEIGNLNTMWAKPVVNGARLTVADMDNFLLVELAGYDEEGVLQCKPLSDVTHEGFLLATVEEEQLMEGETYVDFYNEKGEIVRLIREEEGVRHETSAFSLNEGVTTPTVGMVAHFDPATKKYIISKSDSPHASYATAVNKYEVVNVDTDFGYAFDKTTIRLEAK